MTFLVESSKFSKNWCDKIIPSFLMKVHLLGKWIKHWGWLQTSSQELHTRILRRLYHFPIYFSYFDASTLWWWWVQTKADDGKYLSLSYKNGDAISSHCRLFIHTIDGAVSKQMQQIKAKKVEGSCSYCMTFPNLILWFGGFLIWYGYT